MCEHFKHTGHVVDVNKGGMAALGDDQLVERPDGATLILCFGQRESIRQYTIAFTHNNKNRLLQPSVCFCLQVFGVPAQEASTDSLAYYRLMVLFPCFLLSTIFYSEWPICTFLLAILSAFLHLLMKSL